MSPSSPSLLIDIGQTSTRAVVGEERHHGIGEHRLVTAEPGEHLTLPGAAGRAIDRIERCWQELGAPAIGDVLIATTGFDAGAARRIAEGTLGRVGARRILVVDDAAAETLANLSGAAGVLLIAGTGCVALASDGADRWSRQGGMGWAIGDEPGGFLLGRLGLGSALAHVRGQGGSEPLAQAATTHFGPASGWAREVYGSGRPVAAVATFARHVLEAAAAGDAAARSIWLQAAEGMVSLVTSAARAVDLREGFRVVIGGGLTGMPLILCDALAGQLKQDAGIVTFPRHTLAERVFRFACLREANSGRLPPGSWAEASA